MEDWLQQFFDRALVQIAALIFLGMVVGLSAGEMMTPILAFIIDLLKVMSNLVVWLFNILRGTGGGSKAAGQSSQGHGLPHPKERSRKKPPAGG